MRDPLAERLKKRITDAKEKARLEKNTAEIEERIGERLDDLTRAELASAKQKFREMDQKRNAMYDFNNDGGYYCCLVFPTQAHRDAFLTAARARVAFADGDNCYIDGMHLARRFEIELPPPVERPEGSRLGKLLRRE
jgi:hypothetical protein